MLCPQSGDTCLPKSWESGGGSQVEMSLKVGTHHRDDEPARASGIRICPWS